MPMSMSMLILYVYLKLGRNSNSPPKCVILKLCYMYCMAEEHYSHVGDLGCSNISLHGFLV